LNLDGRLRNAHHQYGHRKGVSIEGSLTFNGPIQAIPASQAGTLNEMDPEIEVKNVKTVETIL
jgi:hypothetical protein